MAWRMWRAASALSGVAAGPNGGENGGGGTWALASRDRRARAAHLLSTLWRAGGIEIDVQMASQHLSRDVGRLCSAGGIHLRRGGDSKHGDLSSSINSGLAQYRDRGGTERAYSIMGGYAYRRIDSLL